MFENGQIANANDLIAAGLKTQGLPNDKDSVANLSVEDAYSELGVALAAGDDADDEENEDDE